jgi:hypothetical protein
MSHDDRRNLRSERPQQALTFLLHSCRARGGFDALVISDDAGFIVAHASALDVDVEEVAAVLPEPSRRRKMARLKTTRFDAEGQVLFVGAIGGDKYCDAVAIDDALEGVRRILAA